jgi:hypothetical protein
MGTTSRSAKESEPPPTGNPLGWVPMALGAWFLIFVVYEILERTLLSGTDATIRHLLHLIRGSGTCFLVAGLVAWYHQRWLQRHPPDPPATSGLRSCFITAVWPQRAFERR